jgi:hypothetical protein
MPKAMLCQQHRWAAATAVMQEAMVADLAAVLLVL